MGKKYWVGRQEAAVEMAQAAKTSEARIAHYELASRHSIKAARRDPAQGVKWTATPTGREASHSETSGLYVKKRPPAVQASVETCRENARFDTAEAARMESPYARGKYERSAASWTAQGNRLDQVEARHKSSLPGAGSDKADL
jgi:hypothetical protein